MRTLLAILLLASVALAAPSKKKKKVEPPNHEAAISKILDAEQEKVAQCVLASAPQGVWSLTVHVKISVSGAGQVMGCRAVLDPERTSSASTADCVEQVLRASSYPKTGAPLVTIDRKWTFSMQE